MPLPISSKIPYCPQRNTHQATGKALGYINSGYQHIVEIDLKEFFDLIDHALLLQLLYRKIKYKHIMYLIRRWLRAPLAKDGKLIKRRIGVPHRVASSNNPVDC